ncbi:MAG: efflux RND transporter periplasmic adaptor subunit [Deltaproteobacteria bacterium]|nr:efflux RND transporter periplasmic adaptor subunit [Deltaproteobacteria bacterium]
MMMKKNIYIVIAVIVGVVIGAIGMKFFLSNENRQLGENGKNASKVMRVLYWQAPMDPTYIKDKPGKSPMGMELIPVYEGTETSTEAGVISIDPTVVQNIGVKTTTVKKIKLEKTIKTIGRIDYDEKRVATVHSKVDGWVEKLYVDYTGMNVKKNDILLELYSPALISAQEEYLMALKSKDDITTVDMDSLRELSRKKLELWDVPAHQIKELEEGGKVLRTLHIHSPATGVVTEKPVTEGMYIRPGTRLYTIADISSVWVYADIYEHEISLVKVGQNA